MAQEQDRTPNDELAEDIATTLVTEGFVPEDKKDQLLSKIKSGTASQSDWYSWVDLATIPQKTEGKSQ